MAVDGDPGSRGTTPVCCAVTFVQSRDKSVEASDEDSFGVMGTDMQVMQRPTGARRSSWGSVSQESSLDSGAA